MSQAPKDEARNAQAEARARATQIAFAAKFAVLAATLSVAYYFPYRAGSAVESFLAAYLAAYAHVVGALLAVFDPTVHVFGQDVSGRFAIHIARDCDAMEPIILFASAVLAWPASWRSRIIGLVAGTFAIIAVNVARLCSMYLLGVRFPSAFDFAHRELWPLILIAVVIAAFVVWVGWTHSELADPPRAAA